MMKMMLLMLCTVLLLQFAPVSAATTPPSKADSITAVRSSMKEEMDKLKLQLKDQTTKLRAQQKEQRDKLKTDQKLQITKLKTDQKARWQKFKAQVASGDLSIPKPVKTGSAAQ